MEKEFNEKEGLELINSMILTARNNLQKGMGSIFLLWGYLIAFISILILILLITLPHGKEYFAFYSWFLMPLALPVHYRLLKRMEGLQLVRTYIDRVMTYVWVAFGISCFLLIMGMLVFTLSRLSTLDPGVPGYIHILWSHWDMVIPIMLILYGFALFVSGKSYRFKPLVVGSIVCWLFPLVIFVLAHLRHYMEFQMIALFVSILCGYIIPGHLLQAKDKEHVSAT
jgi:hypothetical protein